MIRGDNRAGAGNRWWRRGFGVGWRLGLVFVALLAASPLWFPWLLRPAGRLVGLGYGSVDRLGYWRLRLEGVGIVRPEFELHIGTVTILQPLGWLTDRLWPGLLSSAEWPAAEAQAWRVVLADTTKPQPSAAVGTAGVLDQVVSISQPLRAWVRSARLLEGQIVAGATVFEVPEVIWDGAGRLRVTGRVGRGVGVVGLEGRFSSPSVVSLSLHHAEAAVGLDLNRDGSGAWAFKGRLDALGNGVDLEGRFQGATWLPESASAAAAALRWPTNRLEPPSWLGLASGRLTAGWASNRLRIEAAASADVTPPGLPPQTLTGRLVAEGDWQRVVVRKADLEADWFEAELAEPIGVGVSSLRRFPESTWKLRGDLAELGRAELEGRFTGVLRMLSGPEARPEVRLELEGDGLAVAEHVLDPMQVRVALAWPRIEVEQFEVSSEGMQMVAMARADLARREWLEGHWRMTQIPVAFTNRLGLARAEIEGAFSGPLLAPRHRGTFDLARLGLAGLHPLNVAGKWEGQALAVTNLHAWVRAKTGEIAVEGRLGLERDPFWHLEVGLARLDLARGGELLLGLVEPATVSLAAAQAEPDAGGGVRIAIPGLRLAGGARRLSLSGQATWPFTGNVRLSGAGLRADDMRDFVEGAPEWVELTGADVVAGWTNGPVVFDADVGLALGATPEGRYQLEAGLRGVGEEVQFEVHEVRREGETIGRLSGRLPLVVDPRASTAKVRVRPWGALEARLSVNEEGPVWRELTRWLGLVAEEPRLEFRLGGTSAAPEGQLRFQAARIRSLHALGDLALPALDQPRLEAELGDNGRLTVAGQVLVAGQPAVLRAALPLDLAAITNGTVRLDRTLLHPLEANLRLPDWDLAALATWFPEHVSPQGTLDLTASVRPGLVVEGQLRLTNAATRPMPPLGALRQIQATVRADEAGVRLEGARGELSGQPVFMDGYWRFRAPATSGEPILRFSLGGTNLALARRADVFLRGDVDLEVAGSALTNVVVGGSVRLRNSLLLRDLHSLVSGNIQEPASRPPFFSVRNPPWGDWRLDLRVEGDRFLRVVTPVFRGRVSTGLQLAGTLREPVALGEVTVPEGRISFPFGGLNVDHGRVSLTRESPFVPQISFQASGLNFGFDVRMDVAGAATAPNVTFSSVPPLTSTQILLMLSSGDIPNQTFSYSARSRLQNIAVFVGKAFLSKLTGDPESDRLTMRSGERVSDRGRLTYSIEYRLSPRWSVFGMQDRFDNYLGGLKWRVYSK